MSSVESRPQTFLSRPHDDGRYLCPLHKTWQLVYFAGVYRSTGLREGKKLKSPEKQKVKELLWKSEMQPVEEDGRKMIFLWGELTVRALNRPWQHGCRWERGGRSWRYDDGVGLLGWTLLVWVTLSDFVCADFEFLYYSCALRTLR